MSRTDLEHRFLVDPWVTVVWLLRRDTEDEEEEEEDDRNKDETDDEDKDNDEGDGYSVCPRKSCRTSGPRQLDSQLELPQEAVLATFERGKGAV
jgi:hypothetical protein